MSLHFSIQEKDIVFEHTNDKCHLYTL
jgi:hypothetical protein